jgi:hypothetical protein
MFVVGWWLVRSFLSAREGRSGQALDVRWIKALQQRAMRAATARSNDGYLAWGLFVRAVAVCYAVTFLSEAQQMLGLLGSRGILPVADFIAECAKQLSAPYRYLRLPTLYWLNASDAFIALVPWLGLLAALLVLVGIGSRVGLLVCYGLHQSTVVAGGDFFFYPWDFLLLETTILALFVPALRRLPALTVSEPPLPIVALSVHFLLFRLQFGMGTHKFFDATDQGWLKLTYVYLWQQAQPMPTAAAWYAVNYVPMWMHACMDVLTFVTEVPLPFLLFIPGKPRLFATLTIAVLHTGIAVFGNFGTFQLVTLTLCIACLSDAQVYAALNWVRRQLGRAEVDITAPKHLVTHATYWQRQRRRIDAFVGSCVAITAMLCGVLFMARMMQPNGMTALSNTRWLFAPEAEHSVSYPGMRLLRVVSPFFLSYPYGIFRESAPVGAPRRGIVFQGSADGVHWNTYDNKFNPVEPIQRPPQFFAPYQPRLDHLFIYEAGGFHFAYLNGINPYYGARTPLPFIAGRLFEQSADVLSLFASNPFPARPPVQVRVRIASYRFTSAHERRSGGAWWARSEETILGPLDTTTTKQLIAAECEVARRSLRQAVEVDEWKRAGASPPPAPDHRAKAWMPAWKFWLAAAPGWLALCYTLARRIAEVLRSRRRRARA